MHKFSTYFLPIALALAMLTGCASVPPGSKFTSISYGLHAAGGGQEAVRSISAEGSVEGSHMSMSRSGPPMLSMGKEEARPEDLAEIATLANRLRNQAAPQAAKPEGVPFNQLVVRYADGQERRFYRPASRNFDDTTLQRLETIIRSYRAGHW